jgi:hypothetical protein
VQAHAKEPCALKSGVFHSCREKRVFDIPHPLTQSRKSLAGTCGFPKSGASHIFKEAAGLYDRSHAPDYISGKAAKRSIILD